MGQYNTQVRGERYVDWLWGIVQRQATRLVVKHLKLLSDFVFRLGDFLENCGDLFGIYGFVLGEDNVGSSVEAGVDGLLPCDELVLDCPRIDEQVHSSKIFQPELLCDSC